MLNKKKLKEHITNKGMMSQNEVLTVAEEKFTAMIDVAIKRAMANGRKTVMVKDL